MIEDCQRSQIPPLNETNNPRNSVKRVSKKKRKKKKKDVSKIIQSSIGLIPLKATFQ